MADEQHEFDDGFEVDETEQPAEGPEGKKKGRLKTAIAGSGRSLLLILALAVLLIGGGAYAIKKALTVGEPEAVARVQQAPDAKEAPTGEGANPRYAEKVREENRDRTERAKETGESSIPTLVDEVEVETTDTVQCDERCQEMQQTVRKAEQAAEQARQKAAMLEKRLQEQREAMNQDNIYTPDRIEYKGHLYMSREAEQQRLDGMKGEMDRIAAVMTGGPTHGYADTVSMETPANVRRPRDGGDRRPQTDDDRRDDAKAAPKEDDAPPLVDKASTLYATLDMTANSDVPGPIRATVQQGRFKGSRVLGNFQMQESYLVMRFTSLTTPEGTTYPINAIAVNPATRMTGMADVVDRHLFTKIAAIGGAAFLQGFGEAFQSSGNITVNPGGQTVTKTSALRTTEDKAIAALGQVGEAAAEFLKPYANRKTTVIKYADTGMALLFLDSVMPESNQEGGRRSASGVTGGTPGGRNG